MSMGSGSSGVTPIRSSRPSYEAPSYSTERAASQARAAPTPVETEVVDPGLPVYISVGGGLSNQRIVKKLPEEVSGSRPYEATLNQVIKYVTGPDVTANDSEVALAGTVRERMAQPDCRVLVNNLPGLGRSYNLGREALETTLGTYLTSKEQQTGAGTVKINMADIAIVTHDEGGCKYRSTATIDALMQRL